MKVLLVSSDLNFRAPAAAMLGVRGLEVYETDDVFDAIAAARKGSSEALLILHGVDADDVATAQRGAAKATARTVVAVVGADAPPGAHAVAFDGRFPPLVDALVALASADTADATPHATSAPDPTPTPAREPEPDELLALARFGSYYELLGLGPDASDSTIVAAIEGRRGWLAARAQDGAPTDLLEEIAAALDDAALVLGDATLRRLYTTGLGAATGR